MEPDEKGVIFSQWTSYLDILENEFIEEGYTYTRLDGTMSTDQRVANMEAFDSEGCDSQRTPRFILCSLMACGTGINLTRGNVVFLMDPWWNAAVGAYKCPDAATIDSPLSALSKPQHLKLWIEFIVSDRLAQFVSFD